MKIVLKILGSLVALLAVIVIVEVIASESGEVVVLETQNDQGQIEQTRLWVVDYEGRAWLRSGSPMSGWYQRLQANNVVQVTRSEETMRVSAEPVPAMQQQINTLMNKKYGWADSYISMLFGRDDAVPIRLDPVLP